MVWNVFFVFMFSMCVNSNEGFYQPLRSSAVWGYFTPPLLQREPLQPEKTPMEAMVELTNNLGVAILQDHSFSKGNFAFSPYGVASVLVVLYEGARGESARQIHRAIGFPLEKDIIRVGFRDIHRHLRDYFSHEGHLSGICLNKQSSSLKHEFKKILKFYGYDVDLNQSSDEYDFGSGNSSSNPEFITTTASTSQTITKPPEVTPMGNDSNDVTSSVKNSESTTSSSITTIRSMTGESTETTMPVMTILPTTVTKEYGQTTTAEVGSNETDNIKDTTTMLPVIKDETTVLPVSKPVERTTVFPGTTLKDGTTALPEITLKDGTTVLPVSKLEDKITVFPGTTIKEGTTALPETTLKDGTTVHPVSKLKDGTTILPENTPKGGTTVLPLTEPQEGTTVTTTTEEFEINITIDSTDCKNQSDCNNTKETTSFAEQTDTTPLSGETVTEPGTKTTVDDLEENTSLDNGMLIPQPNDPTTTTTEKHTIEAESLRRILPGAFSDSEEKDMVSRSKIDRNINEIMKLITSRAFLWLTEKENHKGSQVSDRKIRTITDYLKSSPHNLDLSLQLQNGMYDTHVSRNADLYRKLPKLLFLVDGAADTPVPMMIHTNFFSYAYIPRLHSKALEFPLDDVRYKLLILLPVERRGLKQLLYDLLNYPLSNVLKSMGPERVKVMLPTFMVEGFVILTSSLQKLGIRDVFDPRKANLSGMSTDPELYVRNVEQSVTVVIRNYVEILDIQTRTMAARQMEYEFKATHPFLYFVLDSATNVALMAGQILDPLNSRIY